MLKKNMSQKHRSNLYTAVWVLTLPCLIVTMYWPIAGVGMRRVGKKTKAHTGGRGWYGRKALLYCCSSSVGACEAQSVVVEVSKWRLHFSTSRLNTEGKQETAGTHEYWRKGRWTPRAATCCAHMYTFNRVGVTSLSV